jgi:hypothetical protein
MKYSSYAESLSSVNKKADSLLMIYDNINGLLIFKHLFIAAMHMNPRIELLIELALTCTIN